MSEGPHDQDEALVDLLIKQITDGLSPDEQRTLDGLDGELATSYARDLERAAAAITLAGLGAADAPPPAVLERLHSAATAHYPIAVPGPAVIAPDRAAVAGSAAISGSAAAAANNVVTLKPRAASRSGVLGWLAAAACLVLAAIGWMRTPQSISPPLSAPTTEVNLAVPTVIVKPVVPPQPRPLPPPTPAEDRDALLANSDTLKVNLGATKDPAAAGVVADVVWDPATQKGFVRLVGLAANDPQERQYQLWIFDGGRDKRYPVDGGVFDVPAGTSELILPIRAALPVLMAKAFAVTVEKPGGTVVSGREHVVVLGTAG